MELLKGGQFGITLKRWFKSNNWPQSITQDWAHTVKHPNGPWASQISKAMNGKAEPKPEFFLALAAFNEAVCERKVQGFTDRRLVDRIISGQPICHENGEPYDAPAFFSLYVGLIEPPEFAEPEPESVYELTQEELDMWHQAIREMFRLVAIQYMLDKPGAWALVRGKMIEQAGSNAGPAHGSSEDLIWCQEILSGFRDATMEERIRVAKRWAGSCPLMKAMETLLGKPGKKEVKEILGKAHRPDTTMPFATHGVGFRGSINQAFKTHYARAIAYT